MRHLSKILLCVVLISATPAAMGATADNAQQPQAPAAPSASASAPRPPANVQLDLVVTDTRDGKAETKSISLLIAGSGNSSTRATGRTPTGNGPIVMGPEGPIGGRPFSLNVDARADVVRDNIIQVRANFEFNTGMEAEASLLQSINVYLQAGRKLLVSRSADPVANRTVTVELTATIREP